MKIEIKSRFSGNVLFAMEAENWRIALELAVKSGANLSGASLSGANLCGANLSGASLYGAKLSGANLYGASLSGTDLSGASLYGANLSGADLSGADLSGTDLSGADLSGANLCGANLYGANLCGANLCGANLYGANLCGANLYGADLSGTDLSGANLSGANLSGTDLSGADLSGTDLSGANLSGANLSGTKNLSKYFVTPLLFLFDQIGPIRAYKLVNQNGEGPFNGGINYLTGEEFVISEVDTSEDLQCGKGINLATLDWCMKEWKSKYRILIMEFTAEDIVAIPTATDGKFRVRKCKRVGEKDLVEIGLISQGKTGET